ncbi:hypothetical protein ACFSTI_01980 [Rhizorhabdus histidinilytica]
MSGASGSRTKAITAKRAPARSSGSRNPRNHRCSGSRDARMIVAIAAPAIEMVGRRQWRSRQAQG